MSHPFNKIYCYFDQDSRSIHIGPEPCPDVRAMGAAVSVLEAMMVLGTENDFAVCGACHDRIVLG